MAGIRPEWEVAYQRSRVSGNLSNATSAGVTFAFELLLSWNVAFVATHNLRKRIVLKRTKIAHFYVWHSTFIFDFISTMVFIVQVRTLLLHTIACWHLATAYICTGLLWHILLPQEKLLLVNTPWDASVLPNLIG